MKEAMHIPDYWAPMKPNLTPQEYILHFTCNFLHSISVLHCFFSYLSFFGCLCTVLDR